MQRTPAPQNHDQLAAHRAEVWNKHTQESLETGARARVARSALNADIFLLKMHYKTELAKPLTDVLESLRDLATDFLPQQDGGRTPEYQTAKDLPIDRTAEAVHKEIELLWVKTIYPSMINDF